MNILLVGGKSHFLQLLIEKLNKEGHRIFILTDEPKSGRPTRKVFETYHFSYEESCIREVVESIQPDETIFLGAFDTNYKWAELKSHAGAFSAGLMNVLSAFVGYSTGRFIYLSSEEVFQQEFADAISEDETPAAVTAKGQALAVGEGMCKYYRDMGKDVVTLRLDHMYGMPESALEAKNICGRMCVEAIEAREILIGEDHSVALLLESDAVEFIYRVVAAQEPKYGLYQISSGEPISQKEIAEILAKGFDGEIAIVENPKEPRWEPVLSNTRYAEEFGIRIFHTPEKELPPIAKHINRNATEFARIEVRPKGIIGKIHRWIKEFLPAVFPFLENMICFIPFFMLNNRAVGREYFQNIDFYLLYVLLFAIVYGQQQATFSSLLAVAGYTFRQMYHRSGFDVMLDYNTYIWIAQLLILGLAVGYMRDRLRVLEEEGKNEVKFLSKQIDDIADINVSNVRIKEMLSTQIVNQNDSFGKLYEITSSLDKYEPGEVLFYAAEVLAQLMGSKDVAIYSVANRSYARLFSATSQKARSLGNSINYVEMEEMYEQLQERKVYINKNMDERYPLMADAIYSEENMQLILMVWGIPWERMTLGQANMLTVIGYLIQNAVLRANRYMSALEEQRYIEGTNILGQEAFRSLVKAYMNARNKELTECALILIDTGEVPKEEAGHTLSKMIRQSDFLGELEDGNLYALLANTNEKSAEMVETRFQEAGFECSIQEDDVV